MKRTRKETVENAAAFLKNGGKKRNAVVCMALAIVLVLVFLAASGGGTKVETAMVTKGTVEDTYTEEGTLSFGDEYQITAQVSGAVQEIFVKENQRVEKDAVLFHIDSTDYEYQKALAESALMGYEAQLELSRIGQIMTTSPQEYLTAVQQELAAREADYQAAKSVYEADQSLYASGFISRVQMEADKAAYESAMTVWQQAKGRYEESSRFLEQLKGEGIDQTTINNRFYDSEEKQLKAQIQSQETQIAQLEDQIEKCQVKAPVSGIITALPVKGMTVIQAGVTGATLKGQDKPTVQTDVLTNIAPYIRVGDPVEIVLKLRGKDEKFGGTVSQVYDYASQGVSSLGLLEYRVHVEVELEQTGVDAGAVEEEADVNVEVKAEALAEIDSKANGGANPGANSRAEGLATMEGYGVNLEFCLYSGQDCLIVPSSAVFEDQGQHFVYQIKMGRAVKVPVEVEYQAGTQTVIWSGLEEGQEVIDQVNSEGIYEGAKVKK